MSAILPLKNQSLLLNTDNGIVSFNGYFFKPLIVDSSYKKQIFSKLVYFEKSGELFGFDQNNQLFLLFPHYHSISINHQELNGFEKAGDSLLIFDNNLNLYTYRPETGKYHLIIESHQMGELPRETFNDLLVYNGKLFVLTGNGLFAINLQTKKVRKLSALPGTALKINPYTNELYCLFRNGLFRYKDSLIKIAHFNPKPGSVLHCIEFRDSETVFVGSEDGIYTIYSDYYEQYGEEEGLYSNHIHSLYYDRNGDCLFAGTLEKGMLKLQFKSNYSFSDAEGIRMGSLNSIIKTHNGEILLCESRNYISKLNIDTVEEYFKTSAYYASLSEINNKLFIGTWGRGVLIVGNKKIVDSIQPPQLPSNRVHACMVTSDGNIWIGSSKGIACGKTPRDIKPRLPHLIKETVICFYELKNNNLCIGAVGCFYIINNSRIIAKIDEHHGLKGKEVRSFYEDNEGKIWIGTYGGGLYCYHNGNLVSLNAKRGCRLDENVFCIAPDGFGYLYLTSNHGLWRISEKTLNDFYYNKINYLIPFLYDEETGILNSEFNGGFQNNFLKTKNNHFYFPTIQGLIMTFPDELAFHKLIPTIDNVLINDTSSGSNTHTLKRNTVSIQIDFSCTNLSSSKNVYFQHKLMGESNYDWSSPQKSRTVYLKVLPPGKYKFIVRAIDGFNDPTPSEASFEFEIEPYFYETTWFTLISGIGIGLLIFTLFRYRILVLKRRSEEKEQYNRMVAEIELRAIQAQLNPHFIFNCLNSIKYFIVARDFENANKSLNSFSSLIRDTLENSEKLFLPFDKKIKFIINYIELEKLRLKDRLSFEIKIDPAIEQTMLMPSLLIQPHVENAIKHGIANLENKPGFLTLEFEKHDNTIVCIITDNGIGRAASRLLNEKNPRHSPKGTELTREKATFLKQYNNYVCTIEITDLIGPNNQAQGTRVTIKIPIYNDHWNNR